MYTFLYQLLPRYISVFDSCTGSMDTVKSLLADKEVKAWNLNKGIIPAQDLAYIYCQDLLACSQINAEDLNLCGVCPASIAGHPPQTCDLVKPELTKKFSLERAKNEVSWNNKKLAFYRSPKNIAIIKIKV